MIIVLDPLLTNHTFLDAQNQVVVVFNVLFYLSARQDKTLSSTPQKARISQSSEAYTLCLGERHDELAPAATSAL